MPGVKDNIEFMATTPCTIHPPGSSAIFLCPQCTMALERSYAEEPVATLSPRLRQLVTAWTQDFGETLTR